MLTNTEENTEENSSLPVSGWYPYLLQKKKKKRAIENKSVNMMNGYQSIKKKKKKKFNQMQKFVKTGQENKLEYELVIS